RRSRPGRAATRRARSTSNEPRCGRSPRRHGSRDRHYVRHMRAPSIGRILQAALLGTCLLLAFIAAIGVGSLYDARQRYEDRLARAYELEAAASRLLAAGVIEEAALQ